MRLKTKQFECWIDMQDDGKFLIQELPPSKQKEILSKHGENKAGIVIDLYKYQFRDWEGITDEDGKVLSYSKENLALAIENDLDTLNAAMILFRERLAEHEEAIKSAEKN
jgi:S-adenosylmethionine:diacylglycerol 3-amino-3-carboxypropyl transferase